jgi:hypothetical protein
MDDTQMSLRKETLDNMPVFDLYSKRQKKLRGEVPDIYQYDDIPRELRVQIIHIWEDAFSNNSEGYIQYGNELVHEVYRQINNILCREYGLFELLEDADSQYRDALVSFFLSSGTDKALDIIELSFRFVALVAGSSDYQVRVRPLLNPDEAIEELNQRFREQGIGYQFESDKLIRIDSQLIHAEVVKPALNFLSDVRFKGANEEYLKAHEHYRHRRYKECLNDCLKAFESTMKAICDKRGWTYSPTDTASKLIDVCFKNGLIPSLLQSEFSALRTTLECGVPTVRNKLGGHGQGAQPTTVPSYLASYLLHLTATNILLLVEAEKELP